MSVRENDIAIVGMSARLPGARDVGQYWSNLRNGVESVVAYTDDELIAAGVRREILTHPNYVRAGAPLDGMDLFDAEFFGFSPKEAAIMDPQHRQFLEASWEALEDAGHPPENFDGAVGVFAGCGMGSYFMLNLLSHPDLVRNVGMFLLRHTGNDKDFLATRASYLLDLKGPSINVQTACSTSLVATHLAVQHLLSGECDLALAGGVTIEIPHRRGYHYEEGEVLSPDGHCRAFDHRAAGTVFGSGVGVVVLRRLQDAIDDGDQIYAVVKGTAVNNDGSQKVGYLAPSVDGQAACIAEALAVADVPADTITYVECHGTGTAMGDPIEVAALTQAFRESTADVAFCGLGSVKTNIGHLDTAAGVAGLIKASLALRHGEVPSNLNFERENPRIDFEGSPFFVNTQLREWKQADGPRRAGVNSLGVGGTNAFAVLEEAPEPTVVPSGRPWQLLVVSGRNRGALDDNTSRLAAHLREHPELDLGDVSFTLATGRRAFAERRVVAARDRDEAIDLLERVDQRRVFTHTSSTTPQSLAFLFPGGGAQYPRMAAGLYETEPVFRQHVDHGLRLLQSEHGVDLRPLLLCAPGDVAAAAVALEAPSLQLPAIFLVEHALAQLLISSGLQPTALLGHSAGENTAACVAGTMSFQDCLGLVVLRGRLFDTVAGGMLAVTIDVDRLQPLLDELGLDLAAVNGPDLCVASGRPATLAALEERLVEVGAGAQRVNISVAAHSRLLEPILDEFGAYLRSIRLAKPKIPWVSNRTGTWITDAQATDPQYWVDHLRNAVRFADGVATLAAEPGRVFLEVGPGRTLSSLAKANRAVRPTQAAIPLLRHPDDTVPDEAFLLTAIGRLWAAGGALDVQQLFGDERRQRVSLPTYAFQSQRYFIDPGASHGESSAERADLAEREADPARWFWEPVWRRRDVEDPVVGRLSFLVVVDDGGIGDRVVERLRAAGDRAIVVREGDSYQRLGPDEYRLSPQQGRDGYERLVRDLESGGDMPDRILHLSLLASTEHHAMGTSFFHRNQELGFYSLLFLAQAWAAEGMRNPLHVLVATAGMQRVHADDRAPWPEQSTILGPAGVIPRELPGVTVSCIDLLPDEVGPTRRGRVGRPERGSAARRLVAAVLPAGVDAADVLCAEARARPSGEVVAVRHGRRFLHDLRHVTVDGGAGALPVREGAVVLVTGGLGGIATTVVERLATARGARLVLLSRSELAPRDHWAQIAAKLGEHHSLVRRIRAVERLEAAIGAEVTTVAVDVADVEGMRRATAEIRARFGGIHAVVHAAGAIDDGLIATKTQAGVEDVLAPKVAGTLVLDEVLRDDDLDLFVVFSSTSTVTAPMGQIDYVAANAFLDHFVQSRHGRSRTKYLAIDWGVWNEVGMAAEAAMRLDAGLVDATVAACSHPFFRSRRTSERGVHELFSSWSPDPGSPDHIWLLDEHRTRAGHALVPGSAYPEIARAALAEVGVDRSFELEGLVFLRPLAVPDAATAEVRARLTPTERGYLFELHDRVVVGGPVNESGVGDGRVGWRRAGQATIVLGAQAQARSVDLDEFDGRCAPQAARSTKQEDHLSFGPRWGVVEQLRLGDGEAVVRLHLPDPFAGDLTHVGLHPAMVDLATGMGMDLIDGYTGATLWVPLEYERIVVSGLLAQDARSWIRVRPGSSEQSGFATFDVTVTDAAGRVVLEVEAFSLKRLEGGLELEATGDRDGDVEFDSKPSSDRHLSRSELAFQHNTRQGIRPAEGAAAFESVLRGFDGARVVVSSLDLGALVRQTTEAAGAQTTSDGGGDDGATFARPQLDSDYVAARDGVEEALVEMWQELLGLDQVGVRDSFFDLGGHSLIAVRLFARIRKTFAVDLPISALFEAPTVEACAELIKASGGAPSATEGAADGSTPAAPVRRFSYLVPMHQGSGGHNLPFFLVAGMFGNVLNLRHLANQIGTDREFYGIQARGVYGGQEPHESFDEMARDYLVEVRSVQPHGPYLFGGFSGGGYVAIEMARMLAAEGEETALVVLLDTPILDSWGITRVENIRRHLQSLRREPVKYPFGWLRDRWRWAKEKQRRRRGVIDRSAEGALHSTEIEAAFYRAIDRHDLRRYPGTLTLFRPELNPTHVFGPGRQINAELRFLFDDNGWGPYCERVDVTEVPGTHDSMVLEPNVRVLAGRLRAKIVEAEREALSLVKR